MSAEPRMVADRYRLDERIGSGGMGVVWRAHDLRLHRTVAVKQLLLGPGLSPDAAEESRARAMREGRIAARLQHPHAINVFDVALGPDLEGGEDHQPWLVMEYLPSRSLADVLAEGPLPPLEVARIGRQIADALTAAHRAGIVHRDVKPGNVLIGENGTVKITDFGIARATWDATVTRTGVLTGTPAYFAPEVARGEPPDPASDVFSLGATLYTAVEGRPPFGNDDNTLALLRTIAEGKVRPPSNAGALTALLMQLLRHDPGQRPLMAVTRDLLGRIAARAIEATTALPAAAGKAENQATDSAAPAPVTSRAAATGSDEDAPAPPPATLVAAETDPREEAPEPPPATLDAAETDPQEAAPPDLPPAAAPGPAAAGTGQQVLSPLSANPAARAAGTLNDADDAGDGGYEWEIVAPLAAPEAAPGTREDVPTTRQRVEDPRWWQRRRVLAGATVLLLFALGAVFLTFTLGDSDDPTTAAPAATSATAPVTITTPVTTPAPSTTTPDATTSVPPAEPGPEEFAQAVQTYYGLLPDQLDEAYSYLGPGVQDQAGGREGYENFWSQFSDVGTENVQANGTTVTLTIIYTYPSGNTLREPYVLEMGTAEDGRILILNSRIGTRG